MKKFFLFVFVAIFSIWLVPLAPFVAPSQDAKVCEGRRAICLCRHNSEQSLSKAKSSVGVVFQSGQTQTSKESSNGFSPRFLIQHFVLHHSLDENLKDIFEYQFIYSFHFTPSIDQVPKLA